MKATLRHIYLCRTANMSWRTCVVVDQLQSNHIIRVVAHLKWGGDRDTADAVPDHCSFQARLRMYCVWHSIQYQFTTTWQHPERWAKTGTRGILHHPSLQYVHGGQRSSIGGMSVKVVHELLSENSCLHWQPSTSCTTLIWPNHKRSVSS